MVFYACSKGMLVLDTGKLEKEDTVFTDVTASTKDKVKIWDTDDFTYEEHELSDIAKLAKANKRVFGPLVDETEKGFDISICNQFALSHSGPSKVYDYYRLDNFWILYENNKDTNETEKYISIYIDTSNRLFINNEFIMGNCYYVSNPYIEFGELLVFIRKDIGFDYIPLKEYMRGYEGDGVIISDSYTLRSIDSSLYRVRAEQEPDLAVSLLEKNLIAK